MEQHLLRVIAQLLDYNGTFVTKYSSIEEKLALYMSLFTGREDVHAIRWEQGDKVGYRPVYERLTKEKMMAHWKGDHILGCYPLLMNRMCY